MDNRLLSLQSQIISSNDDSFTDNLNALFLNIVLIAKELKADDIADVVSRVFADSQHEILRTKLVSILRLLVERLDNIVEYKINDVQNNLLRRTWKITAFHIAKDIRESFEMKITMRSIENLLSSAFAFDQTCLVQNCECSLTESDTVFRRKIFPIMNKTSPHTFIQSDPITANLLSLRNKEFSDIMSSNEWPRIYVALQRGLLSDNIEAFNLSLQLFTKFLSSSLPILIKECFNCLIKSLLSFYKKCDYLPHSNLTENFYDINHIRTMQIMSLIIETVKKVANLWVRYGEKFVENFTETFLSFFVKIIHWNKSIKGNKLHLISIFALLDPESKWCQSWMHGILGQKALFSAFSSYTLNIVNYCVNEILPLCESYIVSFPKQLYGYLKFITFVFCVNTLKFILSYKAGRQLCTTVLKTSENCKSLEKFIILLIQFCNDNSGEWNETPAAEHITNLLLTVMENGALDVITPSIIMYVLWPINNCANGIFSRHEIIKVATLTVNILTSMLSSDWGRNFIFGIQHTEESTVPRPHKICSSANLVKSAATTRQTYSVERQLSTKSLRIPPIINKSPHPVHSILNFTSFLLKSHVYRTTDLCLDFIYLCAKILEHYEGLLCYDSIGSDVLQLCIVQYQAFVNDNNATFVTESFPLISSSQKSTDFSFFCTLRKLFKSVLLTPLGFYLLSKEDGLVSHILNYMIPLPGMFLEVAHFRLVAHMSCLYCNDIVLLTKQRTKVFSETLSNLSWEYENYLRTGSDNWLKFISHNLLDNIHMFAANVSGLRALLEDDGSDEYTLVECSDPSTLSELLAFENQTEPWHYVALLILRVLTTDLDMCVYLISKLHFQEQLLKLQAESVVDCEEYLSNPEDIIVDECSLLRHHILLTTYILGGPGERMIPSLQSLLNLEFLKNKEPIPKFFFELPPAENYFKKPATQNKSQTALHRLLRDTRFGVHDAAWLAHARRAYKLSRHTDLKLSVFLDLVEQIAKCWNEQRLEWNKNELGSLYPEDNIAVEMTVRYGVSCDLLQQSAQNTENLAHLIRISNAHRCTSECFEGFDWFMATAFLVCDGNLERCYRFTENVSRIPVIKYLWLMDGFLSKQSALFGHFVEYVANSEMTGLFTTLKRSGISWWLVCRQWIHQCFWNLLDWSQIIHWLTVSFLHPPDFLIYFCVSLLKHMKRKLMPAIQKEDIWEVLKFRPLEGYEVMAHVPYMEKLSKKYRTRILKHLL